MDTDSPLPAAETGPDRQVGTLLDRLDASLSIVDSLMEMPLPSANADEGQASEWDLAVLRRLESRLASAMRIAIEGEPEKKSA